MDNCLTRTCNLMLSVVHVNHGPRGLPANQTPAVVLRCSICFLGLVAGDCNPRVRYTTSVLSCFPWPVSGAPITVFQRLYHWRSCIFTCWLISRFSLSAAAFLPPLSTDNRPVFNTALNFLIAEKQFAIPLCCQHFSMLRSSDNCRTALHRPRSMVWSPKRMRRARAKPFHVEVVQSHGLYHGNIPK